MPSGFRCARRGKMKTQAAKDPESLNEEARTRVTGVENWRLRFPSDLGLGFGTFESCPG